MDFTYENFRNIKVNASFDGTAGKGLIDSLITLIDIPFLEKDEFVYDSFYRITNPLIASDTAGTYLEVGFATDGVDSILNSVTGIIDSLNTNNLGFKVEPKYSKATNLRNITLIPKGVSNITGGSLELIITIARCNLVVLNETSYYNIEKPGDIPLDPPEAE